MHSDLDGSLHPAPGADADTVRPSDRPGLTACSLCVGETLGDSDERAGGQLARLRELDALGVARLTLAECLDECNRGDVVVARPARPGRRRSGRTVWLERVAGDELTGALASWLDQGGPGQADVPASLVPFVIDRSRVPGT
jgi:(2Fe-2S) ferredoxin